MADARQGCAFLLLFEAETRARASLRSFNPGQGSSASLARGETMTRSRGGELPSRSGDAPFNRETALYYYTHTVYIYMYRGVGVYNTHSRRFTNSRERSGAGSDPRYLPAISHRGGQRTRRNAEIYIVPFTRLLCSHSRGDDTTHNEERRKRERERDTTRSRRRRLRGEAFVARKTGGRSRSLSHISRRPLCS